MWFLPLYDENPSFRKPYLTYAIMALCVLWYFGYQSAQAPQAILEYGFIPARLFAGYDPSFEYGVSPLPVIITFLTTMISHGGFMHIFGNLYVMYLLADNIEDAIGNGPKFIAFAIITETVFQWPGVGLLFINAIQFVDIPVMAAYLMLISVMFVAINLAVDLLYFSIDPRLRADRSGAH